MASAAKFLNVDVDIRSDADLAELAMYLRGHACVLNERADLISFEAVNEHGSVEDTVRELLALVEGLPDRQRELWNRASSRCFDVGLTGTSGAEAAAFSLSHALVEALAKVRADIRITVYRRDDRDLSDRSNTP